MGRKIWRWRASMQGGHARMRVGVFGILMVALEESRVAMQGVESGC